MAKKPTVEDQAVELAPDAWERFEAAVDQVVKPMKGKPDGPSRKGDAPSQ